MRRTCYESTLYGVNCTNHSFSNWCNVRNRADEKTRNNMPLPLAVRLILSFSLTASAIWIWLQDPSVAYSTWVALGMTLSTVGDLFMAGLIPIGHRLIGGMITFALAHCFM